MQSHVGNSQVYNDGDQRDRVGGGPKKERFHEGKANSHKNLDSKDEQSLANKLAKAEKSDDEGDHEAKLNEQDPTRPARLHGNEPSKGAKIDAELKAEEDELLKKKGKA